MVEYQVINQKLYRKNPSEVIASDQVGFVKIHVLFDGWDSIHSKIVQFRQGSVVINESLVKNFCTLPTELSSGPVGITVMGYGDEGVIATTQEYLQMIVPSGYSNDGERPIPPTPDLYAQLLEQIAQAIGKTYTREEIQLMLQGLSENIANKADKDEIPEVPTDLSAFNNDVGYLTEYTESDPTVPSWAKSINKPNYTVDEISGAASSEELEGAKETLQNEISAVDAIARGKSRAKVFATKQDMLNWLQDSSHVAELSVGDNFYIKATDTPDYWWDGTQVQELESEKVDLTDYATKKELKTEKERAEQVEDDLLSNIHDLQAKQPIEVVNLDGSMTPAQVAALPNGLYYFVKPVQRMNGTYSCQGLCSISEDTVNNFDYGHFFNDFNGQVYVGYGAIDGFGLEEAQEAISALEEQIKKLELYKFPNVTIIGEPAITHGQISEFSTSSYLKFPFIVDFHNQAFEINMCFTTGSNVTSQENIFDSDFGLAFAVRNGKFVIAISTNGTSWDLGEGVGTHSVQPKTTYYVRLYWNKLQYKLDYSTDGNYYINDISKVSATQPYPKQIYIGVGENFTTVVNAFSGTINLNNANLKVAGEIVWQGMDDAGLSTRADVSLSNIDEAGKQVIRDNGVDVQINGTSITQDGVANVPVASNSVKGVTNGVLSAGLGVNSSGSMYLREATDAAIAARYKQGASNNYGAITPANLVNAVNSVLCSTAANEQLIAEQQLAGRQRLGLDQQWVLKGTLTTDNKDTGVTVDLSGCTEIFIKGTGDASSNIGLSGTHGVMVDVVLGSSVKSTANYWSDSTFGLENSFSKQHANENSWLMASSGSGRSHMNGRKTSDITTLYLTGSLNNITRCNIEIYAR